MRYKVEQIAEMRFLEDQHRPRLIIVRRDVPADSLQLGDVCMLAHEGLAQHSDLGDESTEDPLIVSIMTPLGLVSMRKKATGC